MVYFAAQSRFFRGGGFFQRLLVGGQPLLPGVEQGIGLVCALFPAVGSAGLIEGAFQDFIRHGGQPVPVRAVGNNIHFTLQPEKLPSRVRIGGFQNRLRIVIIMAVQKFEQGGQVFTDFRLFADVNLPVVRGDARMPEQGGQAGKHGFQFRIELQHIFLFRQCFGLFDVQGKGHLVIAFGFPVPGGQGAGLEINLRFQVQAAGQFINMGHGPFRGPCGKHGRKWGVLHRGKGDCALRRPWSVQPFIPGFLSGGRWRSGYWLFFLPGLFRGGGFLGRTGSGIRRRLFRLPFQGAYDLGGVRREQGGCHGCQAEADCELEPGEAGYSAAVRFHDAEEGESLDAGRTFRGRLPMKRRISPSGAAASSMAASRIFMPGKTRARPRARARRLSFTTVSTDVSKALRPGIMFPVKPGRRAAFPKPVETGPGQTAITRMPCSRSSSRSASDRLET